MNTATADGGRALYGIARDDMTIKWLDHLNRHHVPGRGMSVDMVVNIGLLLLLGANNFVILYISNIGYVFCHVLALSGFLLLRKDRPNWPRPIKNGPGLRSWPGACGVQSRLGGLRGRRPEGRVVHRVLRVHRAPAASSGLGVLVAAVLLYFYRRVVQDKAKITFRDTDVPTMPNEVQMELLREEEIPS